MVRRRQTGGCTLGARGVSGKGNDGMDDTWTVIAVLIALIGVVIAFLQYRQGGKKKEPSVDINISDKAGGDNVGRDKTGGDKVGGNQTNITAEEVHIHQPPSEPSESPTFAPEAEKETGIKVSIAKLPETGRDLFGRDDELDLLDRAWTNGKTSVVSLVAWGGVGKSALVNRWLVNMGAEDYRGAEQVLGWSFYSQGTSETEASAEVFVAEALKWFGDPDPAKGSMWDKGERLAGLVKARKTLLVLDGLEPLQYPPGSQEGEIKDPALKVLVKELAAENLGLCVISTRVKVTDIEQWRDTTAPAVDLENLKEDAGAQLLKSLGVVGAGGELKAASRKFKGHGLALNLLGTYLHDKCGGDIRHVDEVHLIDEDLKQGKHAKSVMAAYVNWLGEGPELAVLRLMGLFDRPAESPLIEALKESLAIGELTESLVDLADKDWNQALSRLRSAKLLAEENPDDPGTLDAHPLVREYFGDKLQEENPKAWKEGHGRLYVHLKEIAEDLPDTIEEMAPLFQAVTHGCAAGKHKDTYEDVYLRRISRGEEAYSTKKLCAFGSELVALSGFFDVPWTRPVDDLTETSKAFVLSMAGFCLQALGRLSEATQPQRASMDAAIAQENWKNAAIAANNLSEQYLTLGDLPGAVKEGRRTVKYSDRSRDKFEMLSNRTALADALNQAGDLDGAESLFKEAEAIQKEHQPKFPILYSLQGFQYCELLLGRGGMKRRGSGRKRPCNGSRKGNYFSISPSTPCPWAGPRWPSPWTRKRGTFLKPRRSSTTPSRDCAGRGCKNLSSAACSPGPSCGGGRGNMIKHGATWTRRSPSPNGAA